MISNGLLAQTPARLVDIHVLFDGRAAVSGVSLEADAGALTVIAGPNGAGKSTLLEVLAGTCEPASGVREVSRSIAFVPQRAAVPPRLPVTVRDVVAVGTWGRRGRARRTTADARVLVASALERLDLIELARRPFAAQSGGQQQRALLAQGVVRRAEVLLLDEPTTGLDAGSRLRIRQIMREEVDRGAAVVCVSHDEEVIADADRVIRLAAGRVAEDIPSPG